MKVYANGATDVGKKRDHNEDAFLCKPKLRLFAVCDGMGGHSAGEVASETAVEALTSFYEANSEDSEITWPFRPNYREDLEPAAAQLEVAIRWANMQIKTKGDKFPACRGMGSTCVAMLLDKNKVIIGNVGDSRCYRLRNNMLTQLTKDQSMYQQMIDQGVPPEQAGYKNVLIQALGMKADVLPEMTVKKVLPGDLYLLCSDGLTNELADDDIQECLASLNNEGSDSDIREEIEATISLLIQRTLECKARDNVTCVLCLIKE